MNVHGADWRTKFVGVTAHLRNRGWTRPFLMLGDDLRAPGMIEDARLLKLCTDNAADNDNRREDQPA